MQIRPTIGRVVESPITQVGAWKAEAEAAPGLPLIDVSQAAPTYPPAAELRDHIGECAQDPESATYTHQQGLPELRAALARALSADYGALISPDQVAVTAGCNLAYSLTIMALAEAGSEVIAPVPHYFSHDMWLRCQGVQPAYVRPRPDMTPDLDEAEAAITPATRAIALVTPNNPSGATYPPELIHAFFELAEERNLALVIDETYRAFRDTDAPPHDLFQRPDWESTLVHLYSFSKAYCMAGYRIGCMVADPDLLREVLKIADSSALCPSHIGQMGALFCLERLGAWQETYRQTIRERIAWAERRLGEANTGFEVVSAGGYFVYVLHPWPDRTSHEVGHGLAREHGILCLAGSMFGPGQDRYLRFAFGNADLETTDELVERLRRVR